MHVRINSVSLEIGSGQADLDDIQLLNVKPADCAPIRSDQRLDAGPGE